MMIKTTKKLKRRHCANKNLYWTYKINLCHLGFIKCIFKKFSLRNQKKYKTPVSKKLTE